MRRGEKGVLVVIGLLVLAAMAWQAVGLRGADKAATEIPFYSDASPELRQAGGVIYHKYGCKSCHSLWTVRDIMQHVPAPALDGIGSLRDSQWLHDYLAAEDPQAILPSRLKPEYRMPSYRDMPEEDRRVLVAYLASLKVKDWYLDETKKAECRKLTGGKGC